jgi:hypothetical protein
MEMLIKSCTRCNKSKPLTAEYFPLHNKTKSGFDSWCRSCRGSYRNGINRGKFRAVISDEALKKIKETTKQCVICGSEEQLVVDHDHKTGKIRGMLCNHCNRGLGHFRDDPMLLEFAAQYLYANADMQQWDNYLKQVESC